MCIQVQFKFKEACAIAIDELQARFLTARTSAAAGASGDCPDSWRPLSQAQLPWPIWNYFSARSEITTVVRVAPTDTITCIGKAPSGTAEATKDLVSGT